jgi:hypothetical protein
MCYSNEHYKQIRLKANAELPTDKLVVLIEDEYRRATWESPEDFTESPNGAHVRLGEVIAELRARFDAGILPDSHVNACGPTFRVEGNRLVLDPEESTT